MPVQTGVQGGNRGVPALVVLILTLALGWNAACQSALPPSSVHSDMVFVPAGSFVMGSDAGREDERPPHEVYLHAFYIDRTEVTVANYARFLTRRGSLTGCDGHVCADVWPENPQAALEETANGYRPRPGFARLPIFWVSWYGAQAYCQAQGKRLPTEAEWEKAARGTDGRAYPWGNEYDEGRANAGHRYNGPTPVGMFPAGASPYGALDMAGNVWEWVADGYAPYPGSTYTSPFFGKYKVVRGGSWNHPVEDARTTARDIAHPARRLRVVGFRCVRDVER